MTLPLLFGVNTCGEDVLVGSSPGVTVNCDSLVFNWNIKKKMFLGCKEIRIHKQIKGLD